MQPPITHYKDEPVDQTAAELVSKEIDAEAEQVKPAAPLKVLPVEKPVKKQTNASNIVNAFRQKMATASTPIELPSIGKTIEFKEISTSEQKELSKIALQSNSRSDIMYCAMLSLINKLVVDKGFDIKDYTEFERILVTLNLQQMNKLNPKNEIMGALEAWNLVYKAICNSVYHSEEEFDRLPPLCQNVLGNAANLREMALMDVNTVKSVEQSHFIRQYDAYAKREAENMKLPPSMRISIRERIGIEG